VLTAPSGPQSSISSSIAEDLHTGAFVMAAGSAGGSRIITATLQNLHHHLDQGLSANDTVHSARWHDQLTNVTYFEIAAPQLGIAGIRCVFVCSPVVVTFC
jgi:gamma-glutamyltranspeptidase/glutathione hydrolase